MKSAGMLTVLALALILCLSGISKAAISLTVNDQPIDSIELETGQSCTIKIVSDDSGEYDTLVGFGETEPLGTLDHTATMPEAGSDATVTLFNEPPSFYGYEVVTGAGPLPGVHFVFQYEAVTVGGTVLKLWENYPDLVADSVNITVTGPPPPQPAGAQFTYQGRLIDANEVADGLYDFEFKLFHDPCDTRTQVGQTIEVNELDVIDGYFTVELDFNNTNSFNGDARWLEIGVRPGDLNDPNVYTTLSPRQEVTAAPYTLYAKTAENVFGGIVGGGASNYVPKFLSSNSIGNSVIYESGGGNVGLGTTSPATKLDVMGVITSTGGNSNNWNTAYGWGNHAMVGYLTAETDPTVLASVKDGIAWGEVSGIPAGFADGIDDVGAGDNLGNHTATQNVNLNGYWLSGDGGSEGVYVANDGNVGIGTTNPSNKLDVTGSASISGNVGLGTTSPVAKLEVAGQVKITGGSPAAGKVLTSDSVGLATWETPTGGADSDWIISDSNMYSGVSGNVGIGTANPAAKLEVNGTIKTAAICETYTSNLTPVESNRWWQSVAMSANGTKQTAVVNPGLIYVSTDSGDTWTTKESNRGWVSVAMSADGTKQTAVEYGGQIYVSTNSGNTWTAKESNRSWCSVAMSADGTKQTAVVDTGQIYVSTDSGNNWTAKESDRNWYSVAMSADGTKQTAVVNGGPIYVSTNSGNTWTAKESNRSWRSVAMSADGTKQTAVVYNGQIYISCSGVGIGTTTPAGRLDVNGSIYQRGAILHADYVFEPGYKLESIDEHSEFMWQEKHLPAMPKMQKDENGREMVEIGARSKGIVEELEKAHIYIEQLNKENKELRAKLTTLDARLDTMESLVDKSSLQQKGGVK